MVHDDERLTHDVRQLKRSLRSTRAMIQLLTDNMQTISARVEDLADVADKLIEEIRTHDEHADRKA